MIRVLITDDNGTIRRITGDVLTKEGFLVSVTSTGKEALEILRYREPGTFQIFITDYSNMPEMTGLEIAKLAKEIDPRLYVILFSSFPIEGEDRSAIDEIVSKPEGLQLLHSTILKLLGKQSPEDT